MPKPRIIMDAREIQKIRKEYTAILDRIFPHASILMSYQDKAQNKKKKTKNINPNLPASAIIYKAFPLQFDADGNEIQNREQAYIDAISSFEDAMSKKPNKTGNEHALLTAISVIRALNSIESTQNRIKIIPDNNWLDLNMNIADQFLDQLARYRNQLKNGLKEHNKNLPDKFFIKEHPTIINKITMAIEDLMEFIRLKINKKASPANPHQETIRIQRTLFQGLGMQTKKSINDSSETQETRSNRPKKN